MARRLTNTEISKYLNHIRNGFTRQIALYNLNNRDGVITWGGPSPAKVKLEDVELERRLNSDFLQMEVDMVAMQHDRIKQALYALALGGNFNAIKFYLVNVLPEEWQDSKNISTTVAGFTNEQLESLAKGVSSGVREAGANSRR